MVFERQHAAFDVGDDEPFTPVEGPISNHQSLRTAVEVSE